MNHKSIFVCLTLLLTSLGSATHTEPAPKPTWDAPKSYYGRTTSRPPRGFPNKTIALTFDDGPTPNITPQLLATLRKEKVPATFFVLGQFVNRYPKLAKQAVSEGHAIGIHTYTHSPRPTLQKAKQEMVQTASAIEKTLGGPTRLFRSPYGDLRSAYTREALRLKYANILWSNSSADTVTRRADVVYKNVIQYARPGDIVLMHDSATKAHTAKALPRIIATLKKRGYRFLTVPEMLAQWEEWKQKTPVSASKEPARAVARKSNAGR